MRMSDATKNILRVVSLAMMLILIMAVLAYVPLMKQRGFYKDDWHMIYSGHAFGPGRIVYAFESDRPFMGKIYAREYNVLGDSPMAWQLFGLSVRVASVVGFWWLLHLLWPKHRLEITAAAVLFILYPGFLQQPNANTFQNHFVGYTAEIFSMVFALLALRTRRWWLKSAYIVVALIGQSVCFWFYEYMIGLEVVKWLLIAYWFRRAKPFRSIWFEIKRLVINISPYILGTLGFLYWRFFIFNNTRPATDPELILEAYRMDPVESMLRLLLETGKDVFETIFAAWVVPLYQLAGKFSYKVFFVGLLIALPGVGFWLIYRRCQKPCENESDDFNQAALVLGGLAVLLAIVPVIVSNRNVIFGDQYDRYTLHATLGAALFLSGGIASLKPQKIRVWLMSTLIVLALMTHFLNSNYWANLWTLQRGAWQQIAWRVPQLEDDTLLMVQLPSGYRLAEDYEIFSPANLIYSDGEEEVRLKGEVLLPNTLTQVIDAHPSLRLVRSYYFERDFSKTLLISWTDPMSCVHVQDADRLENNPNEEPIVRMAAPYSRADLIVTEGENPQPPENIFGPELDHGWCYYYQKASLARQKSDWKEVVRLADDARTLDLAPVDLTEWVPLLEGYIYTGRLDDARNIVELIQVDEKLTGYLCTQLESQPDRIKLANELCP